MRVLRRDELPRVAEQGHFRASYNSALRFVTWVLVRDASVRPSRAGGPALHRTRCPRLNPEFDWLRAREGGMVCRMNAPNCRAFGQGLDAGVRRRTLNVGSG